MTHNAESVAGMEHVGWCWPHQTRPEFLMFMPNDGGEPPRKAGIRPVYAPLLIDGKVSG